jgi:hypothetical protein
LTQNFVALLESANPNPAIIAEILKLTDRVPDFRFVIDHLPHALPPNGACRPKSLRARSAITEPAQQRFL